mgnify:CR=1 FL=1
MNTIILGLVNSYRLNDRINSFNNSRIKFTKLNHLIESVVNKHIDKDIDKVIVENIINDYDKIFEDIQYQFPNHIRQKVIKKWGNKKKLPNSLEIDFQDSLKTELVIVQQP